MREMHEWVKTPWVPQKRCCERVERKHEKRRPCYTAEESLSAIEQRRIHCFVPYNHAR